MPQLGGIMIVVKTKCLSKDSSAAQCGEGFIRGLGRLLSLSLLDHILSDFSSVVLWILPAGKVNTWAPEGCGRWFGV